VTLRRTTLAAVGVTVALATGACSAEDSGPEPAGASALSTTVSLSSEPSPTPTPTPAKAAPVPRNRACYAYGYAAAVAPVARGGSVPCARAHTAITFSVGDLDTVVGGHLVSVDSDLVQAQVAEECPRAFERFVGGSVEARRLSMLRPVWFTPSLPQSDEGANWYRCDAVAIAADERLARLVGRLQGVLGRPLAAERYAMCGTAEPGTPAFKRVACFSAHAWRALSTVDIPGRTFPGIETVRAAGQQICQDAASAQADDPLNYRWGYEWPTEAQWRSGQHYGICWAPDQAGGRGVS
jgi:Septum formation